MFTGIIESIGTVRTLDSKEGGRVIGVRVPFKPLMGESIALNGACLTVSGLFKEGFHAFVSSETMGRTTLGGLKVGSNLHVERAVAADGRLGGHIVSGHVDGVGTVAARETLGETVVLKLKVPAALTRYLVEKGSLAVDGVSLTINAVAGDVVSLMLVPFTLKLTQLGKLEAGDAVNLEADVISKLVVRTVERILGKGDSQPAQPAGVTMELLLKTGFLGHDGT